MPRKTGHALRPLHGMGAASMRPRPDAAENAQMSRWRRETLRSLLQ